MQYCDASTESVVAKYRHKNFTRVKEKESMDVNEVN